MPRLNDKAVVVAGGTGNVGAFIVRALLERGATVAVPSRSGRKLVELRAFLTQHVSASELDRLKTFVGKRVQIDGSFQNVDRGQASPETRTPSDVLPELRGTTIREVAGMCAPPTP